jgi:predicted peptidase
MPIIVFFHGSGESGTNVELVKKWGLPKAISEGTNYNAIIIAPQCTSGNRWFTGSIQEKVLAIINKTISDYSANPNKVSVTGFSIGGTGVYSIIENHHGVFASGVPVSAATEAVATSRFPDVPVWIFAGSKEGTLSSYATSIYNSFKKWKGTENYHLNIISGKDHTGMVGAGSYNIYTDPTYNIVDWMISQTKK